jgi:O-antigen/teichoic acid export membrane protein
MQPGASPSTVSRRGILRGIGASYIRAAVGALVTLIGTPVFLSMLGQETYGLFLAVTAWTAYLAVFQVGFPQAAGNQMAAALVRGDQTQAARVLRVSLWLTVTAALVGFALCGALSLSGLVSSRLFQGSEVVQELAMPLLATAGLGFLLALPFQQYNAALRALQRVHLEQLFLAAARVAGLVAGVAVLLLDFGAVVFAVSQAAIPLVAGAACGISVRRLLPRGAALPRADARALAGQILSPGLRFLLLSFSGALIWSTDNIVISMTLGAADVTPYAVSYRLITLVITWLGMGIGSLTPTVTALWAAGDRERLERLMLQVAKLGMAAAVLAAIEFAFFGRDFVRLWAGPEATVSAEVMSVFVATLLVVAFTMTFEVYLIATSQHAGYAYMALCEGLINLGLSVLLVQHLGLLGVALGTLAAHALGSGWFVPWSSVRRLGMGWRRVLRQALLPLLVPAAGAVAAAHLLGQYLPPDGWLAWLACAALCAIVFAGSFAVFSLNDWERDNARRLLGVLKAGQAGSQG